MFDHNSPLGRANRSTFRIALALTLGLATFVILLGLGASKSPGHAAADDVTASGGPLCFYRNGYPICVERPGPNALSAPDAITPEALLTALLDGPTPSERAQGVESALPPGTRLISAQALGPSITVRLAFPGGFLASASAPPMAKDAQYAPRTTRYVFDALTSEAIVRQVYDTLVPLGYRDFFVEAEDPAAPGTFRPLSTYLPPVTIPPKGGDGVGAATTTSNVDNMPGPTSQPPVEAQGRPQGALSGKTVYVSAGHGWQWNGSNWRTQRPPYPDATVDYYGPIIEDHNNAEVVSQYLLRYLRNAGADVWTARERDLSSFEHILDDAASGFVATGDWVTVHGRGYSSQYVAATSDLVATAVVTWTSGSVPADGLYGLYVWYVPGSDRAADAHYTVHHAGGTTELTLDQRHHGHTWRYVGSFPVRGGEGLSLSLSNESATVGQVVVADAIRLGGGRFEDDDLAINGGPVETDAPYAPDEAWWEIAAYYHVQRLGVDPDDFEYFNDVVARPFWARWEHATTGEDAIYVSWHTNGFDGHNTVRWGTVSYIHSFQPVTGSAELRHAIHSELINDARAGWDPSWRDRGESSLDLGELRELWDDGGDDAIPGVLLEIAYHDHVTDTNALKDPRFALLSARAVYQGIVKYFGEDLTLLPEPPTHLVVRNDGPGQVRVNWRPSPIDSIGLVGDAAESYRVYISRDGLGWDNGRDVVGTQTTLTGLTEDELIFVRVTAVNAGGESFPTPVLAARSSHDGVGRILIVDGFDRIDRHGLILEDDPTEGINARLFPNQINNYDYVIAHGEAITLPFDGAVNEAVADGDLDLAAYSVVDWFLGEESTVDRTFDGDEQAVVSAYLTGGGALFVSGAEIGWDLVTKGNGPSFFQDYLGADMVGDDAETYLAAATAEGIFSGLGTIEFRDDYDADYPDQLAPRTGSVAALNYIGGNGGTAAIQYDAGGCRRVVYLGFPFETIAAAQRPAVMARVLGYLGAGGCLRIPPQTTIAMPVDGGAFNTVPDFEGTASGYNSVQRVEVQISDPQGRYWDGHDWIAASLWLTAVGTSDWYYPLPPAVLTGTTTITTLEQGEHRLWARAWDTVVVSDPIPAFASFVYDTISPTMPTLLAPANGITLTSSPTGFFWRGSLGDTGSALGYNLQIDSQILTLAITNYVTPGWFAPGEHTWRVRVFDAAGNRSSWTTFWTFVMDTNVSFLPLIFKDYDSAGIRTK